MRLKYLIPLVVIEIEIYLILPGGKKGNKREDCHKWTTLGKRKKKRPMLRAAGIIGDEWGTGRTESDLETSKQLRERRRRGDHNAEERGQGFQSGHDNASGARYDTGRFAIRQAGGRKRRCKWHNVRPYTCARVKRRYVSILPRMMDSSRAHRLLPPQREEFWLEADAAKSRSKNPFVRFPRCRTNPLEIFFP